MTSCHLTLICRAWLMFMFMHAWADNTDNCPVSEDTCVSYEDLSVEDSRCVDEKFCHVELETQKQRVKYELESLCQDGNRDDYKVCDEHDRPYFVNLCGYSRCMCVPRDGCTENARGAVIRFDSNVSPTCNQSSPECMDPNGQEPICCTKSCVVWHQHNPPMWSLLNEDDPAGGIEAKYEYDIKVPSSDPGQDTCQTVHTRMRLRVYCNSRLDKTKPVSIVQLNRSNEYDLIIPFESNAACAKYYVSIGWLFVFILLLATLGYCFIGILYISFAKHTMALPHGRKCVAFCSYTIDGLVFILHLSKECSQRSWAWLKSCLGYPAVLAHEQSKFDVAIEAVLDYKSLSQQYYGRVCSS